MRQCFAAPRMTSDQGEVLRAGRVPLSVGAGSARGPSPLLYRAGCRRAESAACRATTCCIRWAGTPSACPPRTLPSRTTSIRQIVTKKNVARFKSQLKSLGLSFDWDREINTTDPELLQVDAVDFPAAVQARPGLQEGDGRQLVHLLQSAFWPTRRSSTASASAAAARSSTRSRASGC